MPPPRVNSIRMSPPLQRPTPSRRICVAFDSSIGVLSLSADAAPQWAVAYHPSPNPDDDPLGISSGGCLIAIERIPREWLLESPSTFVMQLMAKEQQQRQQQEQEQQTQEQPDLFLVTDMDLTEVVRFDARSERVLGRRRISRRTNRIADLLWLPEASILAVHATTELELLYWSDESVSLCSVSLLLLPTELSLPTGGGGGGGGSSQAFGGALHASSIPSAGSSSTVMPQAHMGYMWPQLTGHVADDVAQTIDSVESFSTDDDDGDDDTAAGKKQGSTSDAEKRIICKVVAVIADTRASHVMRAVSVALRAGQGPTLLPIEESQQQAGTTATPSKAKSSPPSALPFPVTRSRLPRPSVTTEDIIAHEPGKPVAVSDWTNPQLLFVGTRTGTCLHVLEDPARTGGAAAPTSSASAVAKQQATAAVAAVGGWLSSIGSAVKSKMGNNNNAAPEGEDPRASVEQQPQGVPAAAPPAAAAAASSSATTPVVAPVSKMVPRTKFRRCVVDHAGNMLFSMCVDGPSSTVVTGGQFSVHFFSPSENKNTGSSSDQLNSLPQSPVEQKPAATEQQQPQQPDNSPTAWANYFWDKAADIFATYKWVQPSPFASLRPPAPAETAAAAASAEQQQQQEGEAASASAPSLVAFVPRSTLIATLSSDLTSIAWLDRTNGKVVKTHDILR